MQVTLISTNITDGSFQLIRGGQPMWIQGIGGSTNFEIASALGANSLRTWSVKYLPSILPDAVRSGLTVTIGFWLSHDPLQYFDDKYKSKIRQQIEQTVENCREHPSVLMWALGNETNLTADTDECFRFINELAAICKQLDPNHPVMTVLSNPSCATLDRVALLCPLIDVVGVNAYGGLKNWPRQLQASIYKGPFVITEWGPNGHWEVPKTPWGAPMEQNSSEKAETYFKRYAMILGMSPRCLGSYVFLWGQKQERTPTWYSMFVETVPSLGLSAQICPTVHVMASNWKVQPPGFHQPDGHSRRECILEPLLHAFPRIEPCRVDGSEVRYLSILKSKLVTITVPVQASSPVRFALELLREANKLGEGGSFEPRPESLAVVTSWVTAQGNSQDPGIRMDIVKADQCGASITLRLDILGHLRLFIYALDDWGNVATINLPLNIE